MNNRIEEAKKLVNAIYRLPKITEEQVIVQARISQAQVLIAVAEELHGIREQLRIRTCTALANMNPDNLDAIDIGNKALFDNGGPKRNEHMAASGADLCLAFPSATGSPGTWDMIRRAVAHGITTIITPEEARDES